MNLMERAKSIGVEGFLHCEELEKLCDFATNNDCLEIGSFKGLSAFGMAIVAKSLMCVDTFKANSAGQVQLHELTTLDDFRNAINRFINVRYLVMESLEASKIITSLFDFIFVDAMHTYEAVKSDIAAWWPKLKVGGVMAFHDYGHDHFPGVKQAVEEQFGPIEHMITLGWIKK